MQFSQDQQIALSALSSSENIFLTGRAGTGKSTVLKEFLYHCREDAVVLASTGAAAVIVGGRTFHSFFGLGILEGGQSKTVERALKNPLLRKRIKNTSLVVIDEISMLTGETLATAEEIARTARGNQEPWGGLRIIAVGDFAQLPPVTLHRQSTDWAFEHEVWHRTNFKPIMLQTIHRTTNAEWTEILNLVREGICNDKVVSALSKRSKKPNDNLPLTRLFALKKDAEEYNRQKLAELASEQTVYETEFKGSPESVEQLKKHSPIPNELILKQDALVMIRKNDSDGFFVNGSLGFIRGLSKNTISVELLDSGIEVDLEQMKFELLNADGEVTAVAKNFPLTLAYGSTIHKSQGATIDALRVRLVGLWESGQAYVALSRVRNPEHLYLDSWDKRSIKIDPKVQAFHANLFA